VITVVIPVFSSNFLEKAVNSVNKTSREFVSSIVIIMDDPSRRLPAIRSDIPIKTISNPVNLGAGPSRNIGVLFAGNEYISFLDADDEFLEGRKEYYESILKDNVNKCWCSDYKTSSERIVKSSTKKNLAEYLSNTNIGLSTITVRKEMFINYGIWFPAVKTRQDTRWLIALLKAGFNIKSISSVTTLYRIHEAQISKSKLMMSLNVFILYLSEVGYSWSVVKYFIKYSWNALRKHFL
jgi:glycosyltransferase involved in cell wall biosynthesis